MPGRRFPVWFSRSWLTSTGPAVFRAHLQRHDQGRFLRLQPDQGDRRERVGRLMRMHANKREDIEEASAGEIIAIGGMKQVTTGDTVCDENQADHS